MKVNVAQFILSWTAASNYELELPEHIDINNSDAVEKYINSIINFVPAPKDPIEISHTRKIMDNVPVKIIQKEADIKNIGTGIVSNCLSVPRMEFEEIVETIFGHNYVLKTDDTGVNLKQTNPKKKSFGQTILDKDFKARLSAFYGSEIVSITRVNTKKGTMYQITFEP